MSKILSKNVSSLWVFVVGLSFVWMGMVLGISFLEAPLKFQAPSVTRVIGLEIGVIVFGALNIAEWVLSVFIVVSLLVLKVNKKIWFLYLLPISILVIQSIWSLPILMDRAQMVILNQDLEPSYHHIFHGVLEVLKFGFIGMAGAIFTKTTR